MRQTLLSLALLILVLVTGLMVQNKTKLICTEIRTATDSALHADPEKCRSEILKALFLCSDKSKFLSVFHHHSLAETLAIHLRRASTYAANGNYVEMQSELQAAQSVLDTLAQRDALTIENIF